MSELLLDLVLRFVPPERRAWGKAMRAEVAAIEEPRSRRRFARGCVRAALASPLPPADAPAARRRMAAVVLIGTLVTALALYGQHRVAAEPYSGGRGALYRTTAFTIGISALLTLIGLALWRARTSTAGARAARHFGIMAGGIGGLVVLAACTPIGIDAVGAPVVTLTTVLLVVAGAAIAGAHAARTSGEPASGVDAGLWSGVVAGAIVILGLLTLTFAATGWFTHDGATVAQFHESLSPQHAHEYHTHWQTVTGFVIGENDDTAIILGLFGLPLLCLAAGAVGGHLRRPVARSSIA